MNGMRNCLMSAIIIEEGERRREKREDRRGKRDERREQKRGVRKNATAHCTAKRRQNRRRNRGKIDAETSPIFKSTANSMAKKKIITTRAGFEPARAEPNGTCIHRLNHSAIVSQNLLDR